MVLFRWIEVFLFSLLILQCKGNNVTTTQTVTHTSQNTSIIEPTSVNGTVRTSPGYHTTTPNPITSKSTNTTTVSPSRQPTSTTTEINTLSGIWKRVIIVLVGIVVLILAIVINTWNKPNGSKTQVEEATKVASERSCQKNADAEDVSYVSVSFIRRSKCKAKVCNDNDDEDDTVTYSTVKFPSSSAGVSTDPSNLYSTINKQKKHVPA
ncbi:cell wall protein DAN4-like [Simochromis diagramma]|uniref:cell wall protein DAN4-like n=1 Tax=Simochromis diagramma TaxID=43689 RepID=UPI001A7EBDB7|nr:cell wall protein DAN4-like [Simochromis diagramma]XP_039872961.1 cell wall protein DAN4-like [Simochromis diagramma]